MSTIIGNKRTFIGLFAVTFIIISLVFVFGTTKTASSPMASAEGLGYDITMSNAASYDIDAIIAGEIEKVIKHLEETERQKQEAAARNNATISRVEPNYDPGDGSRWDQLAICESGGNWAYPPVAGGFSGGIMFHIGTWRSNGGEEFAPDAYLATREQQSIVAERVLAASGWRAWPGCSRKFGWL